MKTTRQIATRLATILATEKWVPDGVKSPRVYLDAITQNIDIGDTPILIVSPMVATGLYRSDALNQLEVVLAIDSSAFHTNAAAPVETPEGVLVYGSGGLVDSIGECLVNTIKAAKPGANLHSIQMEYKLDSLPVQFLTITVEYEQIAAFN